MTRLQINLIARYSYYNMRSTITYFDQRKEGVETFDVCPPIILNVWKYVWLHKPVSI
jgi:hypothetical protein